MHSARSLFARDSNPHSDYAIAPSVNNLLFGLLALVGIGVGLAAILYILRRRRASQNEVLPTHQKSSNHHRLTITATPYTGHPGPKHVHDEKRNLIENSSSPPDSPIPEIRITFPDEEHPSGQKQNGRVVVVRVGDFGNVGMEPVAQDNLPPYQTAETGRFESLDLERIGGLKEKPHPQRWS